VGDAPRAVAALQQCVAANPDQPAAYLVQAGILEQTSRATEARRVLEQLTARVARDADGQAALALLCLRQVDYGCAARHLAAVLQSRADVETLVRLAHVHRSEGHLQEAIKLLREAFDRSGGQLAVASTMVEVLLQAGETQAIDDLLSVLESASDDEGPERVVELVELCVEAERPARGLALADGQARQQDSAALQIARAEALAKLGRGREAKQTLRGLLDGPQGHAAAVRLSRLLQREGAVSEASDVLRQALTRHGHHDGVVLALSLALGRQGKADPSVQVVRDALVGRPESRELRFGLGAALERVGRWREAIAVMRQLLAKNSKDASAHNFIGYTQVEHGVELKEAERSIRQALYHTPGEGYIMDSLGWLYFRQGRLTEAQRVLRVACRLAPKEAEVLGHLAEVTAALKDLGGALQLLRRALPLSDDPKLTARLRQRLNELEKARVGTRW
jgi:predicted Zn-dependent protease